MLLALGIALDDRAVLTRLPTASEVVPRIEGEQQRVARREAIGQPAMHGQPDLAQHFFLTANLVAMTGSRTARSPETLKQIADAREASTLGFDNIAANRAGIVFAHAVLSRGLSLDEIAQQFTVAAFLPPPAGLRQGANVAELEKDFAHQNPQLFQAELTRLEARIMALPVYQNLRVPAR
jgi:hypothetical protein